MPRRWVPAVPPQDAGVLAHGPLVFGQAPGITVGLHHVQAHEHGVMLHVLLRANGVPAEAAKRQMIDKPNEPLDPDGAKADLGSRPVLHVELNDLSDEVHPQRWRTGYGDDRFEVEARYWISELPGDGRLQVTTSWAQAGLPRTSTVLVLARRDVH